MKKVFILKETEEVSKTLNESFQALTKKLTEEEIEAETLCENNELYQLNILMTLIRLGHLKVSSIESYDSDEYLVLEIKEK